MTRLEQLILQEENPAHWQELERNLLSTYQRITELSQEVKLTIEKYNKLNVAARTEISARYRKKH